MRSSGSVDLVGAGAEGLEARVRELRWCRCRGRASAERSQQGKRGDAAVQWPRMDGGRTNARSAAGPFGARHRGKVGKDGAVLASMPASEGSTGILARDCSRRKKMCPVEWA